VGNWITNDLLRELGVAKIPLSESKITPANLSALVRMIDAGSLLNAAAKEVFAAMFATVRRRHDRGPTGLGGNADGLSGN